MNDKFSPTETFIIAPQFFTPVITLQCGNSKNNYKFTPLEDITPFELSKLTILFITVGNSTSWMINVNKYLLENNLMRHFTVV